MKTINAICLIDDDPITIFSVKKLIEVTKISNCILTFSNGQEALNYYQNTSNEVFPELILLDLNMPIIDGWEFIDAFSQLPISKKALIYILTSSINPEDIQKVKIYNNKYPFSVKHLIKPVTKDKLSALAAIVPSE
ncbi:response regulator [Galbibacter pacificus]|uniref:Response regulator n=1 Tax=Galbibacter pacificus TaxID=2996052 RepID=A0ABT6FVS5_9FLAO|nr:response regulator [Galbibacter pacificus]MDG3583714.1 response regulator [Galbibacter pacificus]MDG3587368.1 response regulator [Galbibacter pacificus]